MRGDVLIRICTFCYSKTNNTFDPFALRKAKIVYNFGLSECKRVKDAGLPLTFKFWKSRLPGCQFWKSRKKTWKSGTSKGDRWTTIQCTCVWKLLL